jgi:hypothetical protein
METKMTKMRENLPAILSPLLAQPAAALETEALSKPITGPSRRQWRRLRMRRYARLGG